MVTTEHCPCGQPLHYRDPVLKEMVQHFVDTLGPTIRISTPWGTWMVPRHYIALHGVKAQDLPALSELYGWERA